MVETLPSSAVVCVADKGRLLHQIALDGAFFKKKILRHKQNLGNADNPVKLAVKAPDQTKDPSVIIQLGK